MLKKFLKVSILSGLAFTSTLTNANVSLTKPISLENQKILNELFDKDYVAGMNFFDQYWYMADMSKIAILDGKTMKQAVQEHKPLLQNTVIPGEAKEIAQKYVDVNSIKQNATIYENYGKPITIVIGSTHKSGYRNEAVEQQLKSNIVKKYNEFIVEITKAEVANKIVKNNRKLVTFTPEEKTKFIKQNQLLAAAMLDNYIVDSQGLNKKDADIQYLNESRLTVKTRLCAYMKQKDVFPSNIECSQNKPLTINDYVNMGLDKKMYERYAKKSKLSMEDELSNYVKSDLALTREYKKITLN